MYRKFQIFEVIPKRVIHKSGISVAFLSPDGGGKSTAIKAVSEQVSGSFYGNVELYFRPHYLSNAGSYKLYNKTSEETTNTDPHGKKLNGKIKSFLRFISIEGTSESGMAMNNCAPGSIADDVKVTIEHKQNNRFLSFITIV